MSECPICKSQLGSPTGGPPPFALNCPRCGPFLITDEALAILKTELGQKPLRWAITSHAIQRLHVQGGVHTLTPSWLQAVWVQGKLPRPQEQADILVQFVAGDDVAAGDWVPCKPQSMTALLGAADNPIGQETAGFAYVVGGLKCQLRRWLGNLGSFLKTRRDLVTLFAAFVVFLSFIVNQEVRDSLKDRVSTIGAARAAFESHRDLDVLIDQLGDLGVMNSTIAGVVMKGATDSDQLQNTTLAFRYRVFGAKRYLASAAADLESVGRLIQRIGAIQNQIEQKNELKHQLSSMQSSVEAAIGKLSPWFVDVSQKRTAKEVEEESAKLFSSIVVPVLSDVMRISPEIRKLGEDVLAQAEQTEKSRSWWYRLSSWLSFIVFFIGWGVALTARLLGIEGVEVSG